MASNFVQDGNVVTLTAPSGGVLCGAGLVVGNLFGIATYDAAQDTEVEVAVTGVFTLPKAAGVINEGARVWWNDTAKAISNVTGAGYFPIGVAVEAAR